ncbi:hypothetical protein HGM15179_004655 [Zosterops borbonicus]|uniref:Uncharacterized protein n=1 Tax=Zosterops borbonicus TaxID=364589 RepID=A0A8K1GQV1_9PASS|nr:hypothetical protein HGM15179_004655 [Zosterops borbonicus]
MNQPFKGPLINVHQTIKSYQRRLWDSKAHCATVKRQHLQQKRQGQTGNGPFIKSGLLLHGYSRPDINLGGGSGG